MRNTVSHKLQNQHIHILNETKYKRKYKRYNCGAGKFKLKSFSQTYSSLVYQL